MDTTAGQDRAASPAGGARLWQGARSLAFTWIVAVSLVMLSMLISSAATILGQRNLTYSIHHTVLAEAPGRFVLEEHLRAVVDDPSVKAITITEADDDLQSACGSRAVLVEAHIHATPLKAMRVYEALRSGARQAGLGATCTGMRVQNTDPPVMAPSGGYFLVCALLMALVWASRRGRHWLTNWADWQPRLSWAGALRWGGAGAVATLGTAIVVQVAGLVAGIDFEPMRTFLPDVGSAGLVAVALLAVLGAPLFEEYVFRAWMLERFSRVIPAWLALLITAALFAAIHVPQTLIHGLVFGSIGIVLGVLWLRTRSYVACVTAHGLNNAVALLAVSLAA